MYIKIPLHFPADDNWSDDVLLTPSGSIDNETLPDSLNESFDEKLAEIGDQQVAMDEKPESYFPPSVYHEEEKRITQTTQVEENERHFHATKTARNQMTPYPRPPLPPTTFHLFPLLPLDLRHCIWALALPGPRIHHISRPALDLPVRSSCRTPTILSVSHEARSFALSHLQPLMLPSLLPGGNGSSGLQDSSQQQQQQAVCYFNPRLDTLFLPGWPKFPLPMFGAKWLNSTDFGMVRNLAVDWAWLEGGWMGSWERRIWVGEVVRVMGSVEVVHVVSLDGRWNNRIVAPDDGWRGFVELDLECTKGGEAYTWVDDQELLRKYHRAGSWRRKDLPLYLQGPDGLSLLNSEAVARRDGVITRLDAEREKFPTGWNVPTVQLDFVSHNRMEKESSRENGSMGLSDQESWWVKIKRATEIQAGAWLRSGANVSDNVRGVVVVTKEKLRMMMTERVAWQSWVDLLFMSTWRARAEAATQRVGLAQVKMEGRADS